MTWRAPSAFTRCSFERSAVAHASATIRDEPVARALGRRAGAHLLRKELGGGLYLAEVGASFGLGAPLPDVIKSRKLLLM